MVAYDAGSRSLSGDCGAQGEGVVSTPRTTLHPLFYIFKNPFGDFFIGIFLLYFCTMSTLTILQEGSPVLRARSSEIEVSEITASATQSLIKNMVRTLAAEKLGAALAAPQIGENVRLFVVAPEVLEKKDGTSETKPLVCINPEITKRSKVTESLHEGCLSVRGWWGYVPRSEKVTMRAYDENGKEFERGASGLLAQIFQHEIDHLNGTLYIDTAEDMHTDEELKVREEAGKHAKIKHPNS